VPEGDSIFRAARTLHRALAGKVVTRFESVLPPLTRIDDDAPLAGRTVDDVSAAGKHLLMRFLGRPGAARIVVATADFVAVAFNVPVAEFLTARALARQPELRRLGPDLLGAGFDPVEAARRIRERAGEEIAEVVLNQRVVAGAGNVYKSEVLFLCRINPFTRVAALTDAQVADVVKTARSLLAANVGEAPEPRGAPRVRRGAAERRGMGGRRGLHLDHVYGRAGLPCRECGTLVTRRAQGPDARLTYWCPRCQP
jgi:endonuclease-8